MVLVGSPDLDVGVPMGSPLDFIRMPVATPKTARRDVVTPTPGAGSTVVESPLDRLPRKPLPLSNPLTVDFEAHLNWKPVEIKNPGTPTGPGALAGYPPVEPRNLYMHCICFYLMLLLHEDQVSPREILCYLTEIGEPAAYAATAVRVEEPLRAMADYIIAAAGGLPPVPPRVTKVKIEDDIAKELVVAFPYEERFGGEFLKLPARVAVTALANLAQAKGHSFMSRNAVYTLRLYDEDDVVPPLRALVKSPDKVIRNRALAGLIRWQDPEIVPWLIDQLGSTDVPFRSYVLYALGRIGDRRGVDAILKSAKSQAADWEFLWAALAALARLRDSKEEVTAFMAKMPGLLNRMKLPDLRRQILLERVRIANAYLGDKSEQAWMRTAKVQEANMKLVEEWKADEQMKMELAKAPPPPPQPAPKAPAPIVKPAAPIAAPPPPPTSAETTLAAVRDRLLEYTGVRGVKAEDQSLVMDVSTDADAADLRILLGTHVNGVRLMVRTLR